MTTSTQSSAQAHWNALQADWDRLRDAMYNGEVINTTEGREVLHVALRANREDGFIVDGAPTADLVDPERDRFLQFADDVRDGKYTNAQGKRFTDVINIGIGGSDLGPVMAVRALSERAFCVQHRRCASDGCDPWFKPRYNADFGGFKNIHHHRNHHQRTSGQGVVANGTEWRGCGCKFGGTVYQSGRNGGIWHRTRTGFWFLGLGRGALFCVFVHRPVCSIICWRQKLS